MNDCNPKYVFLSFILGRGEEFSNTFHLTDWVGGVASGSDQLGALWQSVECMMAHYGDVSPSIYLELNWTAIYW